MSSAATALIWWIVPALGLMGGVGYVLWVTKFQGTYRQETLRSVGQFQRFQDSLRTSQARDIDAASQAKMPKPPAPTISDPELD